MKFVYQYRTSDNLQHEGIVNAASKEAAYQLLKAQGIRPGRVTEAPGFANWLFGKGKRWLAIVFLAAAFLFMLSLYFSAADARRDDAEERAQIYGDPVVLEEATRNGWAAVFSDPGERLLAAHAVPGERCACKAMTNLSEVVSALLAGRSRRVEVREGELREIVQMKRMVNHLKDELNGYLSAGGTVEQYLRRLCIRQMAERGIYESTRAEILRASDPEVWKVKNQHLRAMGLPMVHE